MGMKYYNTDGSLRDGLFQYHEAPTIVYQEKPAPPDECPFPDEPSLRRIFTKQDIKELSLEFMKKMNMKSAFEKGADGFSLQEKFNARVAWIQRTNQQRPKTEEPEAPQLTAEDRANNRQVAELTARYKRVSDFIANKPMTAHCRVKMKERHAELLEQRAPIDALEKEVLAVYHEYSESRIR
jgi:hypothetical protein